MALASSSTSTDRLRATLHRVIGLAGGRFASRTGMDGDATCHLLGRLKRIAKRLPNMVVPDTRERSTLLLPIAGGILALAAAIGVGRFAYTPILPAMQRAVHFDALQAGLLASANYAGYLAGALLVSLVPRSWQRNALRLATVVLAVTTALMASTTNPSAWAVIRFVTGVASAVVFVLDSALVLAMLRRERRSALAGWLYSGVGFGIAVSGLAISAARGRLSWRGDWIILALAAAAAIYPCWRWLPAPVPEVARPAARQVTGQAPRMALSLLIVAYLLQGAGYIVTGTFLVEIAERTPGLSVTGPDVWIVVGIAGIPSCVIWGIVAARTGYARTLALAYATLAGGIILPLLGGAAVLGAAILFGGSAFGIAALTLTLAGRLVPDGSAKIIGILTAAFGIGQVLGPVFAGYAVNRTGNFTLALAGAAAVVTLGSLLMLVLQRYDPTRPLAG